MSVYAVLIDQYLLKGYRTLSKRRKTLIEKTLGDGILYSLQVETKNMSSTIRVLATPEPVVSEVDF